MGLHRVLECRAVGLQVVLRGVQGFKLTWPLPAGNSGAVFVFQRNYNSGLDSANPHPNPESLNFKFQTLNLQKTT